MDCESGLIMHASSPALNAMLKKCELMMSRRGSPNEMFETPSIVFMPFVEGELFKSLIPRIVSAASFCWEETVSVSMSMKMSFLFMPYFAA